MARTKLLDKCRIAWGLEAERKPKLRTFVNIHDFNHHKILTKSNLSRYQRSLISQLKLGILPLKIETDRYQGIPENLRYCHLCNTQSVENEFHFLFQCPSLSDVRNSNITGYTADLDSYSSDSDKLRYMLNEQNIRKTAIFVEKLYQSRQRLIYK